MKINLDTPIKDLNGECIKDGDTIFTVAKVLVNALLTPDQKDGEVSGIEKAKRFKLAMRVHEAGEQNLTVDEIATLKNLIGKVYPPLVVGRTFEILDPE